MRTRWMPLLAGVWLALQGVATLLSAWPSFSNKTIPAALSTAGAAVSGNLFGWLSLLIGLGVLAMLVMERLRRPLTHEEWREFSNWEIVRGKTFMREDVVLDGKFFDRCEFVDVNLVFEGTGPVRIEEPIWRGNLALKSPNQIAITAMTLQHLIFSIGELGGVKPTAMKMDKFGKYTRADVSVKKL